MARDEDEKEAWKKLKTAMSHTSPSRVSREIDTERNRSVAGDFGAARALAAKDPLHR